MKDRFVPTDVQRSFAFNEKANGRNEKFDDCIHFPCTALIETDAARLKVSKKNMPFVVYNGQRSEGKSVAFEPYASAPDSLTTISDLAQSEEETFECGFQIQLTNRVTDSSHID